MDNSGNTGLPQKERFMAAYDACTEITRRARTGAGGIGTLGEKILHAVLKQYFEPNKARHEIKVGGYVADIVVTHAAEGSEIKELIEIQTRAFDKLRRKLPVFLELCPVTVVYPVTVTKWLIWIDSQTGETTKRRKSPRRGQIHDVIPELYKIKPLLNHPNFRLCVVFIDMDEYRCLNGWSKDKKKGSSRYDRIPVGLVSETYINSPSDYREFIPRKLSGSFTSKDYSSAANISLRAAQMTLNILHHVGAVNRVEKRGNLYVYESAARSGP